MARTGEALEYWRQEVCFDLHDDSCVDVVLEILRSDSDPQDTLAKVDALNLVPSFIHHFTGQEYQAVMDLTVNSQKDPDAGVRLTASITLGGLGDTSAVAALQAAVANEEDPNIRSAMHRELERLKRLRRATPHNSPIHALRPPLAQTLSTVRA